MSDLDCTAVSLPGPSCSRKADRAVQHHQLVTAEAIAHHDGTARLFRRDWDGIVHGKAAFEALSVLLGEALVLHTPDNIMFGMMHTCLAVRRGRI